MKKSEIKFTITLDERNHPEKIDWEAQDSGIEGVKPAKSVLISLWDPSNSSAMRIDLWTKEMMVEEMQRLFYETFATMADTYERATSDKENGNLIRNFSQQFGKASKVIK